MRTLSGALTRPLPQEQRWGEERSTLQKTIDDLETKLAAKPEVRRAGGARATTAC